MKNIKKIIAHPLMSGSMIMIAGSMGANVINYFYHLVMGRILGPSDYGVLASLYSILYVTSIVPISTSVAIVKFISAAKSDSERIGIFQKLEYVILRISIVSSLLLLVFSPFIASFLHIDNLLNTAIVAPMLFFTLLTLLNQATSQATLNFIGYVIPNIIISILKLALGVLLIFLSWKVFGAMVAILIGMVAAYFISKNYVKKFTSKKSKYDFDLKPFFIYSAPALIQALAFTSFFTVDLILVKHFFPPYEAGIYASLSTLGKIIYFAAQPITAVMFPIVTGKHARKEKYLHVLASAILLTSVICFGIVGIYAIGPKLAVGTLFGSKFLEAQANLVWMGMFISFYTIAYILINYFMSIGKTKIVLVPGVFAILQIILILLNHNSLYDVIMISLVLMIILSLTLLLYLGYNVSYEGSIKNVVRGGPRIQARKNNQKRSSNH